MLCMPRAVSKTAAEALDAHAKGCGTGASCPQPSCRAPPFATYPACVQNKCVALSRGQKGDQ
jgi:hypothetical protein